MLFFKKHRIISDQIKVFAADRIRRGDVAPSYSYWLRQFSMWYPINDVNDITDADVDRFLLDVSVLYPTSYQLQCAKTAIENLRKYYHARTQRIEKRPRIRYKQDSMAKVGRPANDDRNKELIKLRDSDPKTWTFKALGEHFKIHPSTAHELYEYWSKLYSEGVIHRLQK